MNTVYSAAAIAQPVMSDDVYMLCAVNTALEVVSAETVPIRMYSGNQYGNHEVTYTWNRGEQKEFWLLIIRIYFSGADIHADMMPNAAKSFDAGVEQTPRKTSVDSSSTSCCRLL